MQQEPCDLWSCDYDLRTIIIIQFWGKIVNQLSMYSQPMYVHCGINQKQ